MRTASRWEQTLLALTLLGVAAACPKPKPEPVPPPPPGWESVARDLPEALLSVTGTSATNVWAVGADKGSGPLVLRFDGASWQRIPTGHRGHLWWMHALEDGTAFVGGASGAILRWDTTAFSRMDTPGLGRDTVFGLWGSSANNMYAVGGFSGRSGFIWRFDGTTWRNLVLPSDIPLAPNGDIPGFFKVWGDRAGHVFVVGGRGVVLRSDDGESFRVVPTSVVETLFTVAGNVRADGTANSVTMVGGASNCVVLETSLGGTVTDTSPPTAPLLQGVSVAPDDTAWACGAGGAVFRRNGGNWEIQDTGLALTVESLHAAWVDPEGGVWAVGGNVLSPALTNGVIIHRGTTAGTYVPPGTGMDGGVPDAGPPAVTCPMAEVDPEPAGSMARRWDEQILNAIRRDIPRPPVHARNLYHLSAAMWDAWAAYDATADGTFYRQKHTATDVAAARNEAISYAAYRVLAHRYNSLRAVGSPVSQACFSAFMNTLGFPPEDTTTTGDAPRAVGNRVGQAVIDGAALDGANEAANFADTTGWMRSNPPLVVDVPGVTVTDINIWQTLNLFEAATQNGIILPAGEQGYIGPQWAGVTPFGLANPRPDGLYLDPGQPPRFTDAAMKDWVVDVIQRQAQLKVDNTTMDISPGAFGNNPLGSNAGTGHPVNPVTGQPYAPNLVPRGDFGRVLAEFWADGPKSETPPGHWNTLANAVADDPQHVRRLDGAGPALDPLEWDVKIYLALNGAVHDAAIVAWGTKRVFLALRPLSVVRYMAGLGQSSDPGQPAYHVDGLPLVPGVIELVTPDSSAPGQRHAHLARFAGQVVVVGWPGEPGDRILDTTPIVWMRGVDWVPYQRRNFVTPAFPGFVSGHSTFSRAAAEVLSILNGSPYFPGGLGSFTAPAHQYLVFEDGPSMDVTLQWATYHDAADQAGQSRIWGGIHIQPDDFVGRQLGSLTGTAAVARARAFWDGTAVP